MQFVVSTKAANLDQGGNGLFICEGWVLQANHYNGDVNTSIDHSSFEKSTSSTAWVKHYMGGAQDFYLYGLPIKTEDILCKHPTHPANLELTLVYRNVSTHTVAPGEVAGDSGRFTLQEPILNYYFDNSAAYVLPCLGAEAVLGVWNNLPGACNPATTNNYVDIPYQGQVAIKFNFGWATETAANAARAAAPHVCLASATSAETIKADKWPGSTIEDKYTIGGKVCYTSLPCEKDDDAAARITDWTVENNCQDPACPGCVCLDGVNTWIWSDDVNHEWADGVDAIWSDSLEGLCKCGCPGSDLDLGVPTFLDLPKVDSAGISPDGLEFEVCTNGFSVQGKPIIAVFAHAVGHYGLGGSSEFPFFVLYDAVAKTWNASFSGENDFGPAGFNVFGPNTPGITGCSWHRVRIEKDATEGWRLGVDIAGGANYTWGSYYQPPGTGFHQYGPSTYHWGTPDKVQLGGLTGFGAPPGSLQTS